MKAILIALLISICAGNALACSGTAEEQRECYAARDRERARQFEQEQRDWQQRERERETERRLDRIERGY